MRVCFVVTNTFALNAFLATPIEMLAGEGWDITVALNTRDGEIAGSILRHADVVDLDIKREISPLADLPVLRKLWALCRRKRFDVVHSITPKAGALAMTAALLAGVPVRMHTFTGQVWVTRQGLMRRFLQGMESYVAACATHVLADSPSQREFMVRHGVVPAPKLEVLAEVRNHFRPEFINRIDEIVVFHALDEKNIGAIAKIQLHILEQRLARMEIRLEMSDGALQKVAEAGFDPVYGARPLKRAIQQQIENPLSKLILEGKFGPKDVIRVAVEHGALAFAKGA